MADERDEIHEGDEINEVDENDERHTPARRTGTHGQNYVDMLNEGAYEEAFEFGNDQNDEAGQAGGERYADRGEVEAGGLYRALVRKVQEGFEENRTLMMETLHNQNVENRRLMMETLAQYNVENRRLITETLAQHYQNVQGSNVDPPPPPSTPPPPPPSTPTHTGHTDYTTFVGDD